MSDIPPRPTQSAVSESRSSPRLNFSVVGIGASAGGLEACEAMMSAIPSHSGLAFILVQHLDPTHQSMMVELLAKHSSLTVQEATDGMPLEPENLYIIPPGAYLSVRDGALRLSPPLVPRGARLPFDFLLHSLADECGDRAICVILSGTGSDGSLGLKSVKARSGLVIVQTPGEANFDGMPQSAIATGAVDLVLPAKEIAEALLEHDERRMGLAPATSPPEQPGHCLPEIIALLRAKTSHDFTLYKHGTLLRRVARRMGLASIDNDDMRSYLDLLQKNQDEVELLAKDLLINVTNFFRDPHVFEFLDKNIIPDLIRKGLSESALRIWIPGCSTGEEAYSLAMLFREHLSANQSSLKLQIFASDVDPDALAIARDGLYPETIAADVSPVRLTRFFSKEGHAFRVSPELRGTVVFTTQDVLNDPPFSHLDMISCRNLLIYLRAEAQAKAISIFHFALRDGGLLLLGGAETAGNTEDRFKLISKPERLYRHIGRHRPGDLSGFMPPDTTLRSPMLPGQNRQISRQSVLADLCRRLVIEAFAPAAVLINRKYECLYLLGPTSRYLCVPPGHPTHDLLVLARPELRTKLRSAIHQACQNNERIAVSGGTVAHDDQKFSFIIDVQPVVNEGEDLLLICFVDAPKREKAANSLAAPQEDLPRIAELEQELDATRSELLGAIRNLELSGEEQKAINEEALSLNEEFQSTNEEILTSKEELQSLNEELTALNSQLQETLERQRTTSNDFENVLYSTDLATIFLDLNLNIRFFTPSTKRIFRIIDTDIGRPLADLSFLAVDNTLLSDARTVAHVLTPLEHEIEAQNGAWYLRRILPYRTQDNGIEGVVITFADITERRRTADALDSARRQAQLANAAKSQFLAAASHDLRQPLQTLTLLQGLLAATVEGDRARDLVVRLEETLGAMSGMLDTLLDINQLEVGAVRPEVVTFKINKILSALGSEFFYHAQSHGLELKTVPCSLSINSDPRLLEQMIRNLLSNALKYTKHGKVLLGCRRSKGMLSIDICDTGIGIAEHELQAIFEEHHQIDNGARERSRGLGLGLSIVQRLGKLLGHRVRVRSQPGRGSVFAIEIALPHGSIAPRTTPRIDPRWQESIGSESAPDVHRSGSILVIEDDPEVRELLQLLLVEEGHRTASAPDAAAALELVAHGNLHPDLILSDYNLPNGMDGIQAVTKLRERLQHNVPAIILTGDISATSSRNIAFANCMKMNKPVKLKEMRTAIQSLLPRQPAATPQPHPASSARSPEDCAIIHIVDDDNSVRGALRNVLEEDGRTVQDYSSCEAFLEAYRPGHEACLLIDAYLPGMSGIELLQRLSELGHSLPSIMITGHSDVPMAVRAMKAGASDFIEKPITRGELLASVGLALERSKDETKLSSWRENATNHLAGLTPRQRQIMELVLAGHPSKNIAADLGISQRTVENHRASIMKKTRSKSLPALARLAVAADWISSDDPNA